MKFLREIIQDDLRVVVVEEEVLFEATEKTEAKPKPESKRLRHLHHLEDMIVVDGHHGFNHAMSVLGKTHDFLLGKGRSGFQIKTKYDGYPSVVWGHDPENGKFFVGTKSFHNKVPKVSYTDKDVDTNFPDKPHLADKLKFLLKTLKKSTPSKGIFQGDLMYTSPEISHKDGKLSFTPNTLTYEIDKNSYEGQKIMNSKVGIAPHTHYEQDEDDLRAVYDIDMSEFKPDDDVHYLSTSLRGPHNIKAKETKEFLNHYNKALEAQQKLSKSEAFEAIKGQEKLLLTYINSTVKRRTIPSTDGYISWLIGEMRSKSQRLQNAGTKDRIRKELDTEIEEIVKNKKHLNAIFAAHGSIADAKGILVNALSRSSNYTHSILGEPSHPEGYVVSHDGKPIKLVDRKHFSAANFDWNAKANPEDNPTVMSWGRFQPVTAGHEKLIKLGADIARRTGAQHKVVSSRSQDKKNNPLTPTQKLSWLKSMFPGTNTVIAGKGDHTLVAQLQHLHNQGVRDLTMVVGGDRVEGMRQLLARYNGPGKMFYFHKARVVSAGERDGKEASGTDMRNAAKNNDFKTFKKGTPTTTTPKQAKRMFQDVVSSMTPPKDLMKRGEEDKKAKAEIERRKRNGLWHSQENK